MSNKPEDLMLGLLSKINKTITGGNETAKPEDTIIAWAQPGIPFSKEELQFNLTGLNASGESAGDTVRNNVTFAENFANLVNSIPSTSLFVDQEQTQLVFRPSERTVENSFKIFLDFSEVAYQELTDDQKKRIERYRNLLTEVVEKEDILTGEKKKTTVDGRLKKAYQEKEAVYSDAVIAYNNVRLNALNSADTRAVQEFAVNGAIFRRRVENAYNDWVSNGYKNEYEQIVAAIDAITRRNLDTSKADLLSKFNAAVISNPTTGSNFHYTTMFPANFINNDQWQRMSYTHQETSVHTNEVTKSREITPSGFLGLFTGNANVGYNSRDYSLDESGSTFEISFSIAQAPISRPWFSVELMRSQGWKFADNSPYKSLSDGKIPSTSVFPLYNKVALFIKDLKIVNDSFVKAYKESESQLNTSFSVGWGPFSVGGHYNRDKKDVKLDTEVTDSSVTFKGIQLIGFICEKNPLMPNVDPTIESFT